MAFFLKKLVSRLIFPVPFIGGLLLLGLFFLWSKRWSGKRPRLGKILITIAVALYFLFHYSIFTEKLLEPIEYSYPAHMPVRAEDSDKLDPSPKFIIVFGQSLSGNADLPVTSQVNGVMIVRLIESIRLHRIYPDARIIVSLCSNELSLEQKQQWLDEFASIVGVESNVIDLITGAKDTNDEVELIKEIVADNLVLAVSSASHVPRIMKMLEQNDINAVAAPCGHRLRDPRTGGYFGLGTLFPSSGGMAYAEEAIYERLGLLWEMISGK